MLELRHVGFETDDNKEILRDVSLTVQDRFVAITGPNGGGKSTLAKVIAGIYQPTSGQILLDGVDITHMSITDRANLGLSYAFQQPVRFKGLRVKDLLSLAAGKNTSVNEACSYLSEVGLCARDYVDRELNDSLSGGELKRIEIAMVLARGTKLSIFDEPEAGRAGGGFVGRGQGSHVDATVVHVLVVDVAVHIVDGEIAQRNAAACAFVLGHYSHAGALHLVGLGVTLAQNGTAVVGNF